MIFNDIISFFYYLIMYLFQFIFKIKKKGFICTCILVGMQKGYSREEILRYTARMAKWIFGGESVNKFKIKLLKINLLIYFFKLAIRKPKI